MASIELVNVNKTLQPQGILSGKTMSRLFRGFAERGGEEDSSSAPKGAFSLKDINLTIPDGATRVVLGPSGCGKSTLLRVIAGLLSVDSGEVRYDGVDLSDIPAKDRGIGMVFQNYALYPHYTSKQNILSYFMFREKSEEMDQLAQEKFRRTSELMGVDIEHLLGRMPGHLSGGERQRVALARCITRDPVLFLLDEPFSNLDQKLREKYRINLKKLLQHFKITTIYVTHDQHEAVVLADEISIMNDGRIVQSGTYQQLYRSPDNLFVAEFLNLDYETRAINQLAGVVVSPAYQGKTIGFRPEDAVIVEHEEGMLRARVEDVTRLPLKNKSVLTMEVRQADFQMYTDQSCREGDILDIQLRRFHIFDSKTGEWIATNQN